MRYPSPGPATFTTSTQRPDAVPPKVIAAFVLLEVALVGLAWGALELFSRWP